VAPTRIWQNSGSSKTVEKVVLLLTPKRSIPSSVEEGLCDKSTKWLSSEPSVRVICCTMPLRLLSPQLVRGSSPVAQRRMEQSVPKNPASHTQAWIWVTSHSLVE
jgi:hypothetical protein